jgi:hypothetical protein
MYIGLPRGTQLFFRNREKSLQQLIENEFGIPSGKLLTSTRKKEIVDGRHLYAAIMYHSCLSISISKIGEEIGKDHATVMHSCKKAALLLALEYEYRQKAIAVIISYMRYNKYPKMGDWFLVNQTKILLEKLMVNEKRQDKRRRLKEKSVIAISSRISRAEAV